MEIVSREKEKIVCKVDINKYEFRGETWKFCFKKMDLNRKLSQKYQKMNMKQYNVINDNDHQRLFGKFTTTFHTFIYSNEAYKLLNSVKF